MHSTRIYISDQSLSTRTISKMAIALAAMSIQTVAVAETVTYGRANSNQRHIPPSGPPKIGKGGKVKRW